jgi:hypothetical protein
MYKIWHKLFGWDYVSVYYIGANRVVRRIRLAPNGKEYIMLYSDMDFLGSITLRGVVHLTREIPE